MKRPQIFRFLSAFIVLALFFSITLYAQEQRVTVKVRNASLKDVFKQIEKQTTYRFSYRDVVVDDRNDITMSKDNASVSSVLDIVFKERDLDYKIVSSRMIAISRKKSEVVSTGKMKKISGVVKDSNGEPIIGANIKVEGTTMGTVTDLNGNFTLNVPNNGKLVITYIGYIGKTVNISNASTFNIELKENAKVLDEVVVIGYGTQSKRFVSGSISSVKIADVSKNLPNTNIAQSLNSVPGIVFIGDGRPGQDGSLLIRGQNSLSGGNNPLIVLDGIIFSGSMSDINPQDIESIDILKDASSATVYGSRAANSVILIQTKKGTTEKPVIHIDYFSAISKPSHQMKLLSPERYIQRRLDWRTQQGLESDPNKIASYLSVSEAENYKNGITHNGWDEISQDASINSVNVSISANSKYATYYLSGSYSKDKGLIYNDNQTRNTFRANVSSNITDWLKLGLDATFSHRDLSGKEASVSDAYRSSPYSTFFYTDGEPTQYSVAEEQAGGNPLYAAKLTKNSELEENLFSNFFADINIPFIEGLNFKVDYSPNVRWGHNYNYVRQDPHRSENMTSASKLNSRYFTWEYDNILTYKKELNSNNAFDITFLYSRTQTDFESTTANADKLTVNGLGYDALQYGTTLTNTSNAYKTVGVSYMGRINYRLMNRYLLTLTVRRDGSSVFAKNNKYATFPSGSFAWIISEEPFMKKVNFIDMLKLRASYGSVGNQAISAYQSLSLSDMIKYVYGDGGATSIGIITSTLGNDNLKWENTTSQNLALDFELFKNRLGGTIEFYNSDTKNLLVKRAIPVMNGYSSIFSNIGKTNNKGFELSLHSVNIQSKEFNWQTNFSLSYNQNKIVHLYGQDLDHNGKEDDDIDNGWFIGKPINSYYDYVFDGIYQEGDKDIPTGSQAGFVRVKDIDNSGTIDSNDRTVVASGGTPKYQLYLRNNFEYKHFSFAFSLTSMLDWKAKFNLINPLVPGRSLGSIDVGWWTKENKSNTRPSLNYSNPLKTSWYSSRDFLRVQDVSLSYDFDKALLNKIKISGLRVYFSVKNLLTITDWLGSDPENGGDYNDEQGYDMTYPMPRTYSLGMSITF